MVSSTSKTQKWSGGGSASPKDLAQGPSGIPPYSLPEDMFLIFPGGEVLLGPPTSTQNSPMLTTADASLRVALFRPVQECRRTAGQNRLGISSSTVPPLGVPPPTW